MRILEKTEMKRLSGSFSCVFQLKKENFNKFVTWLDTNKILNEYERFDSKFILIRAVLTDEQLTMLALTFAQ